MLKGAPDPAMKGFLDVVQTPGLCVAARAFIHVLRRLGRVIDDGAEKSAGAACAPTRHRSRGEKLTIAAECGEAREGDRVISLSPKLNGTLSSPRGHFRASHRQPIQMAQTREWLFAPKLYLSRQTNQSQNL